MVLRNRRSKLDRFSVACLAVGGVLFLISAVCYIIAVILLLTPAVEPVPRFTFGEIGNMAGIAGMLIIPLFIASAMIQNHRITKREKTGNDIDDNSEHGAAGSSRPDQ